MHLSSLIGNHASRNLRYRHSSGTNEAKWLVGRTLLQARASLTKRPNHSGQHSTAAWIKAMRITLFSVFFAVASPNVSLLVTFSDVIKLSKSMRTISILYAQFAEFFQILRNFSQSSNNFSTPFSHFFYVACVSVWFQSGHLSAMWSLGRLPGNYEITKHKLIM